MRQSILGDSTIMGTPALHRKNQSQSTMFESMQTNLQSTLRRKIKIARWLTQKIAEYDVTNDFWSM